MKAPANDNQRIPIFWRIVIVLIAASALAHMTIAQPRAQGFTPRAELPDNDLARVLFCLRFSATEMDTRGMMIWGSLLTAQIPSKEPEAVTGHVLRSYMARDGAEEFASSVCVIPHEVPIDEAISKLRDTYVGG